MILVTGAAGTVGSALVAALCATGHKVRALVRDTDAVPAGWTDLVDTVAADLGDPASLGAALPGVEAVYLLVPADPRMAEYERNVIDAVASSADRPRVVLHAAFGFDDSPEDVRFLSAHAEGLAALRATGLAWTALAPNGFLQNVAGMASMVQDGVLTLPAGNAGVSYVDAADVAAAAAVVLTTEGHDNAVYTLTGPDAVTHEQIAERIGEVLGHPVRYQAVSADQARAGIGGDDRAVWLQEGMVELLRLYGSGVASTVSGDLPRLIGRPARSLADYLAANERTVRESERRP